MLKPHKDFRLFLTTEAHHKFPAILLETCFKISYESPPGIKKNLERIYDSCSANLGKSLIVVNFRISFFKVVKFQKINKSVKKILGKNVFFSKTCFFFAFFCARSVIFFKAFFIFPYITI